jgi:SAM-dependent methyltransferase
MERTEFALHADVEDDHWWFAARREIILAVLAKYLPPGGGQLVAEIGCGTGGNLKFLQEHYRVMGVDIAPEAVSLARARTDCPILQGDFRLCLAGRWQEIDALLLADVIEHVDDDAAFLRDCVLSLRPGALALVTVPAHRFLWSNHDVVLGHRRRYSRHSFRVLWRDLPVEELFFTSFNSLLFPLIALYRLCSSPQTPAASSDLRMPAPWVNRMLYTLFSCEKEVVKHVPLPWGVSMLALLRRTATPAAGTPRATILPLHDDRI